MLGKLWQKWKDSRDEKLLAEYAARDAQLGSPTKATLDERARKAAEKGYWKTALSAIDQGADVNMPVDHSASMNGYKMEWRHSLALIAIKQDNAAALQQLLARGAKTDFIGGFSSKTSGSSCDNPYAPVEYAALQGAKKCMAVLLEHGGNPQDALDGALRTSAQSKSYLGMTEALLKAGATDFDGAQRAAEVWKNDAAIILIKGAAKKAFDAAAKAAPEAPAPQAPAPSGPASGLKL